jgi:hypothetical protein
LEDDLGTHVKGGRAASFPVQGERLAEVAPGIVVAGTVSLLFLRSGG